MKVLKRATRKISGNKWGTRGSGGRTQGHRLEIGCSRAALIPATAYAPVPALCYAVPMVKTLERAIAELTALPDSDQEEIGQKLLSHVEKLRELRSELDNGIQSLNSGKGKELDVEELLVEARKRHGRT